MDNLLDVSSNDNEIDVDGNSSTFETALETTVSNPQLSSSTKKKKVQTTSFQDALLDAIANPHYSFKRHLKFMIPIKPFYFHFYRTLKN